jgi:hypothetical protein
MRDFLRLPAALAVLIGVLVVALAPALAAPTEQAQSGCRFVLGFKTIKDQIPRVVGDCLDNEGHNPQNGDGLQHTTAHHGKGGLLVWRKSDNWTAFTDGSRTWVNGPFGLQERANTERFSWEGEAAAARPAPAAPAAPTPTAVPQSASLGLPFAGVYLNGHDPGALQRAREVGAGLVEIQVNWAALEPSQSGTLNPVAAAALDAIVREAAARGMTPVGVVGGAPGWAAINHYGAVRRDKDAAFVTFMENLVARYAPMGVHHWFLWPEPDAVQAPAREPDRGAWGDEPEWYAEVTKRASAAMKRRDPGAKVIVGPIAHDRFFPARSTAWCPVPYPHGHYNCGGIFSYEFLDRIFAVSGFAAAVDAVGLNAYAYYGAAWEFGGSGRDVGAKVRHVRTRLTGLGVDLPIVIGESGVWNAAPPSAQLPDRVGQEVVWRDPSSQLQAEYAVKLLARSRDAGVLSVVWFTLDESDPQVKYGLYDDQKRAKPAAAAFRRAGAALRDGSPTSPDWVQLLSGGVERYSFQVPTGQLAIAWASGAEAPRARVSVPAGTRASDAGGAPVAPAASGADGRPQFELGDSPMYFERAG